MIVDIKRRASDENPLGLSVWFAFSSHQWGYSQYKYTFRLKLFSGDVSKSRNAMNYQVILSIFYDVVWSANMHSEIRGILQAAYACWYRGTVTMIPTWKINYIPGKVLVEITHPFPNFYGHNGDIL